MRILELAGSRIEEFAVAQRDPRRSNVLTTDVSEIIRAVRQDGDKALRRYENTFGCVLPTLGLRLSAGEIKKAYSQVSRTEYGALSTARRRLHRTEKSTKTAMQSALVDRGARGGNSGKDDAGSSVDTDQISVTRSFVPIDSVGCYVPGGQANYPSSAIMSVVPAKVAGVRRIVVVSPTNKEGVIHPMTVVAADMCGATEIYRVGGAHAIAALAYGTESIRCVDKIVGPGGAYVTAAKSAVAADSVGIDMHAGPTELGIVADASSEPELIAADLISQAEHSVDTSCYLITTSARLAQNVDAALSEMIPDAQRGDIIRESLTNNGFLAVVSSKKDLVKLANLMAPEHLQVMTRNPHNTASMIRTPGLVLVGGDTPSSASDYLLGSNHILPTGGSGRFRGSLSVMDFLKMRTVVKSSVVALQKMEKKMRVLTDAEGLPNHCEAVSHRLSRSDKDVHQTA